MTARDMAKPKPTGSVPLTTTARDIGSWSSFQPTSEPITAEKMAKDQKRGFHATGDEPQTIEEAEAEIARLEKELSKPQHFSETISIYSSEDGTQTRSLAGACSSAPGGKIGFNKNSDFSMPIAQYKKTKWKDI